MAEELEAEKGTAAEGIAEGIAAEATAEAEGEEAIGAALARRSLSSRCARALVSSTSNSLRSIFRRDASRLWIKCIAPN
jgi:hypothetical protein